MSNRRRRSNKRRRGQHQERDEPALARNPREAATAVGDGGLHEAAGSPGAGAKVHGCWTFAGRLCLPVICLTLWIPYVTAVCVCVCVPELLLHQENCKDPLSMSRLHIHHVDVVSSRIQTNARLSAPGLRVSARTHTHAHTHLCTARGVTVTQWDPYKLLRNTHTHALQQ